MENFNICEPYTDDSIIMFGKYKYRNLIRVPAQYLLNMSKSNCNDKELLIYIRDNKDKISARLDDVDAEAPRPRECKKFSYPSEKDAKYEIKKIRGREQEYKKPVRAYECEVCGCWHLTSIAHEDWKNLLPKDENSPYK